jgi:hypothetical protein
MHVSEKTDGRKVTMLTCAETAKLVRKDLKEAFPATKFSVRSDTYAGGASIRVRYTDGPTQREVETVIGKFAGADFDGMIDLKTHREHWVTDAGEVSIARTYGGQEGGRNYPEPPEGATRVHFGADFVFADRELSPAFVESIAEKVTEETGRPYDPNHRYAVYGGEYGAQIVWRRSCEISCVGPFVPTPGPAPDPTVEEVAKATEIFSKAEAHGWNVPKVVRFPSGAVVPREWGAIAAGIAAVVDRKESA